MFQDSVRISRLNENNEKENLIPTKEKTKNYNFNLTQNLELINSKKSGKKRFFESQIYTKKIQHEKLHFTEVQIIRR